MNKLVTTFYHLHKRSKGRYPEPPQQGHVSAPRSTVLRNLAHGMGLYTQSRGLSALVEMAEDFSNSGDWGGPNPTKDITALGFDLFCGRTNDNNLADDRDSWGRKGHWWFECGGQKLYSSYYGGTCREDLASGIALYSWTRLTAFNVPLSTLRLIRDGTNLFRDLERRMLTCVDYYAGNSCQEPRDKVYGLLSLANDSNLLSVDYGKSVQEVFLDVAKLILNTPRDIRRTM